MTPATAVIMNRLTRARAAGSRKIRPVVVNLVPDPSFRNPAAELYVHGHNTCELVEVPGLGLAGVTGARVEGRSGDNDTHIAPDGRNDPGRFRLGMRPGATFTASVSVYLPEPLTGRLNRAALRLIPGCLIGSRVHWTIARSAPARNERGDHRISVTFTVPAEATAAWIRLHSGMSQGNGVVYWHSFALTEADHPVDFFDGSTAADALYTYEWIGAPNASPSRRTLRTGADVSRAAIVAEAVRLATAGAADEAQAMAALAGDRLTAARVSAALGDTEAARTALLKVV